MVNSSVNKSDVWGTCKNKSPLGHPAHSPGCGDWWPSAAYTFLRGVSREMENCPLGFDKEMALSCVCVRPAGLSGRLPASCRQRSLKSKVHREAKIPRQAGRDGSRELERQMQGLQRAHSLSGNRGRSGLWDSSCLHWRRCCISCLILHTALFVNIGESGLVLKQVCWGGMLPPSSVVKILLWVLSARLVLFLFRFSLAV